MEDYGDCLIVQSFADLHLHAPQYPMLGMGMDLPLLDWLNAYAFPTEARFAEPDYARTVYRQLAGELASHGTTRVCMFSSFHTDATLILMDELEKAGITGYVGKVSYTIKIKKNICGLAKSKYICGGNYRAMAVNQYDRSYDNMFILYNNEEGRYIIFS